MATPPFNIDAAVPATTDTLSTWPSQIHEQLDIIESWLNAISDNVTGKLDLTQVTGVLPLANGGTGASTQAGARTSIFGAGISTTTDNAIARYDGVTGALQNSGVTIDDSGGLASTSTISAANGRFLGSTNTILGASGGVIVLRPNGTESATGQLQLEASGNVTIGGQLIITGSTVTSGTGNAVLQATGAGTIFLRPNQNASTGQLTVASDGSTIINGTLASLAITATGAITSSSTITALQNFVSSTANVVLASNGVGSVFLRPNGAGSAVGQVGLASNGAFTVNGGVSASGASSFGSTLVAASSITSTAGNVTAGGSFFIGGGNVVLQPASSGIIFLRPVNGGGQDTTIDSSGNMTVSGTLTVTG